MNFARILVPVDLSPPSAAAVRYARGLVSPGGRLDLLHVVDAQALSVGAAWTEPTGAVFQKAEAEPASVLELRERLARRASELLEDFARRHDEGGAAHATVSFGRPADEIAAAAARDRVDLIVVGSHSRGAVDRLFLGSVAEEVARSGAAPTLVVREGAARCEGQVVAAVDPSAPPIARAVVLAARDLARRVGRPLRLASVVAPAVTVTYPELAAVVPDVTPGAVARAGAALDALLEELAGQDGGSRDVLVGDPAFEVGRLVGPADLLVCGSHGRGLLGRIAFGTVSTKLLRQAPCPVLVVRPPADH